MVNRRIIPLLIGCFIAFLLPHITPILAIAATPAGYRLAQAPSALAAGLAHYEAGRYADAIVDWQSALADVEQTARPLDQALVRIHLSLAYQHLGQWDAAQEMLDTGLALVPDPPPSPQGWDVLGKGYIAQGNLWWSQGDLAQALTVWRQAEMAFAQLHDVENQLGSRLNQAQALQSLGLTLQASATLQAAEQLLDRQTLSPALKATGLQSLGNAYRQLGQLEAAQALLEQSLAIAPDVMRSLLWLDLGNTARAMAERSQSIGQEEQATAQSIQALDYYQQAAATAPSALVKAQARVNALSLLVWRGDLNRVAADWAVLQPQLLALAPGHAAVQLQLQALQTVISSQMVSLDAGIGQLATSALQQARSLGNPRLEALALGQLSDLYAAAGHIQDAKGLAQQVITLAETLHALDIRYRWEWQLGRLLKQEWAASDRQNPAVRAAAIAAYDAAYHTLTLVRQDLVGINADVQFSFVSNIFPLYQELADLLLSPNAGATVTANDLARAVEVLDALQRVELENYLRCNLSPAIQLNEADIDPTAAIVYPVVLPDRLEVIIALPNRTRKHYTQAVDQETVQTLLTQFGQDTLKRFTSTAGQARSQQLYDWLIRPAQADFAAAHIRTLVFVLNSSLRNLPLAALSDGQHYLIETYAIAIAPGLQLLQPAPLQKVDPAVLAFGLSEVQRDFPPHEGFPALRYVEVELQEIGSQVQSRQFVNAAFSADNFAEQVQAVPFPIIHLATHGQFSSDPAQTFILTWNERLNINHISEIFRQREETSSNPVELMVLSACETAAGDRRASLGLAGIAVQSGARSIIASLWQVDDQAAADLMSELYQRLSQPAAMVNRAEALRQAQLALLQSDRYRVPAFWAAFVLVGNWL